MDNVIEFILKCGFKNTFFYKLSALVINFSAKARFVIIADIVQVREFHCLVWCHPDGTNF